MPTLQQLRDAIDNYITANGNNEITGTQLNTILNDIVDYVDASGGSIDTYDSTTTYSSGNFVTYNNNIWKYISGTPQAGVTPGSDPLIWELTSQGATVHTHNNKSLLDILTEIATQAEVEDTTSAIDSNIVTSKKLWQGISKLKTIENTWAENQTFSKFVVTSKIKPSANSTNAIGLYKANGTSQDVFYDSTNGRIGIGITPVSKLHIDSGNATESYIQGTCGTTTGQTVNDGWKIGHDATGKLIINQQENLSLGLYTNGTERINITSGGDIDIKTNILLPTTSSTVGQIKVNNITKIQFYNNNLNIESGNYTSTGTDNIFIKSGSALTSGNYNIGLLGLNSIQSAGFNIGIGYFAGKSLTGSDFNVFLGSYAGEDSVYVTGNVAIGHQALRKNTNNQNTAVGSRALYSLNDGYNVALGYGAGFYETGSDKLFIDNRERSGLADGRIKSLIYGEFNAATANQLIRFNSVVQILEKANVGANAAPATSAVLELSGTTGALLVTRLTTTERNALTAVNGMIIYNSTDNKFQGYENGSWTNLI